MRGKIWLILVLALWVWSCSSGGGGSGEASYLVEFRQTALDEINFVRQKPKNYVRERLGAKLPTYLRCNSNKGVDYGLENDLLTKRNPLEPLVLDDNITGQHRNMLSM